MITIVDYGSGNVRAIANIYERLNIDFIIASRRTDLEDVKALVLPGVGAFDDSMKRLNRSGMREPLDSLVLDNQIPVLGVCVGMQMMAIESEEGSETGLGWFANSRVTRFDEPSIHHKPKLPHMGWNTATPVYDHAVFNDVCSETGFYFLHSYHFVCSQHDRLALTKYGETFVSAVRRDNIFGFQFHPEKSHSNGISIFRNFAELCNA